MSRDAFKVRRVLFLDLLTSFYDRQSVYYLTSVLRQAGVEVDYLCSSNQRKIFSTIGEFAPDVVMYSVFSPHIPTFMEFDRKLKSLFPHIFTMIGGAGMNSDDSRKQVGESTIDAACVGEGEIALREFVAGDGYCAKNLVRSRDLDAPLRFHPYIDLDSLPFPDRSVVYERDSLLKAMPTKQFLAGRGCPYKCTYCHNHIDNELFKSAGNPIRLKSVDYFIEEIEDVRRKYPLNGLVFQDDVFFLNRKWGFEFCEKYATKVRLPFTCNLRSNLINEDMIRALREAGCSGVFWSIESGDEDIRNTRLKRNMSNAQILKSAELLNKYAIKHRIGNVIGIPGETFDQMLKTLELNISAKPYLSAAYIFIPFEDLELTRYAITNGYLDPNEKQHLPLTFSKNSILKFTEREKARIRRLMALFPILVKHPELYERKWVFNLLLRVPAVLLMQLNSFFYLLYSSRMYRVKVSLRTSIRIVMRYLSYGT